MKPWLVSHRGVSHRAQENTIAAFKDAQNYPVGYIEFDVRVTKDDIAVIHHDPSINGLDISITDYEQLIALDPKLTIFEDAVTACNGMPLIVELKGLGAAKHIAKYLNDNPKSFATSFYVQELLQLAELGIDKKRMFLGQRIHAIGLINKVNYHQFGGISINKWYLLPWVYKSASYKKLMILTYTMNSTTWAKLIRYWQPKVLICTDRPDKLQSIK